MVFDLNCPPLSILLLYLLTQPPFPDCQVAPNINKRSQQGSRVDTTILAPPICLLSRCLIPAQMGLLGSPAIISAVFKVLQIEVGQVCLIGVVEALPNLQQAQIYSGMLPTIPSVSPHLEQMIQCITAPAASVMTHAPPSDLTGLYSHASDLIQTFDDTIGRCKKYNQAKVNRKYEILIQDLEASVKQLTQKLRLEQENRSPTKKHVSDILDKLIQYRDQNDTLKKELEAAYKANTTIEQELQQMKNGMQKMQAEHPKSTVERLPALNGSHDLQEALKEYLKGKEQLRKLTNVPISNFERFISDNRGRAWKWNLPELLENLDKWSQGIKPKSQVDMWKIRSAIARRFSEYIDQPETLLHDTINRRAPNLTQRERAHRSLVSKAVNISN